MDVFIAWRLESITEVQVLKVGEIEESLLDADALDLAVVVCRGHLEPSVLAVLLLLLLGSCGSSSSIAELVASVQEPAKAQNDDDLAAVRSLRVEELGLGHWGPCATMKGKKTYEDDRPRDTVPWGILGLPPLRSNHLTDRVTDEPHSVVS